MVPELEKAKLTEIGVRMDCNGCVQKIKKALHGINGIYDFHIDFPQQKLTIIGWADPEKIVKAIKKARKSATIISHSEVPDTPLAQPTEQLPSDQPSEQPPSNQPPPDQPPPDQQPAKPPEAAATTPADPPNDPTAPENPPPDTKPSNSANGSSLSPQPSLPSGPKDREDVHVIYYHPTPDHGYRYGYSPNYSHSYDGQWNGNQNYPRFHQEPLLRQVTPQPVMHNYNTYKPSSSVIHTSTSDTSASDQNYPRFHQEPLLRQVTPQPVTHNYNTYKPSSSVIHTYNTYKPSPHYNEDNYIRPPSQYTYYRRPESYSDDYNDNNSNGNGNGNITSIFSDENPNACRIA